MPSFVSPKKCQYLFIAESRSLGHREEVRLKHGQVRGNDAKDGAEIAGREETGDGKEPGDVHLCGMPQLQFVHERERRTALLRHEKEHMFSRDGRLHLPELSGHGHDGIKTCILLHEGLRKGNPGDLISRPGFFWLFVTGVGRIDEPDTNCWGYPPPHPHVRCHAASRKNTASLSALDPGDLRSLQIHSQNLSNWV